MLRGHDDAFPGGEGSNRGITVQLYLAARLLAALLVSGMEAEDAARVAWSGADALIRCANGVADTFRHETGWECEPCKKTGAAGPEVAMSAAKRRA